MSGLWSIIIPDAAVNVVENPSVELATTGFTATGTGTLAVNTAEQVFGLASLQITPSSGGNDGAYYQTPSALQNSVAYIYSVYVKATAGQTLAVEVQTTAGATIGTPTTWTASGGWERKSVAFGSPAAAAVRLVVRKNGSASTNRIYADGLQLEFGATVTTFIDGDQPGCFWYGAEHSSQSYRSADYRGGGVVTNLDALGIHVQQSLGIGLPPGKHLSQSLALLPGSVFNGRKVLPRTIVLAADADGLSRENLHAVRQQLINAIRPDLTAEEQPFTLQYTGADDLQPVEIKAIYDSGLEFGELKGWHEDFTLRLIAYDPFWREAIGKAVSFGNVALSFTASRAAQRFPEVQAYGDVVTGWSQPGGSGLSGEVRAIVVDDVHGLVYFGGTFVTAGGQTVNNIGKYNPFRDTFEQMGSPAGTNGTVRALALAPNGDLYVGGDFTTAGGVTVNYVAKWIYATQAWAALGTTPGLGAGGVYGLVYAKDGTLYATGGFTVTGVGTTVNYVAKYTPSTWSALGTGTVGLGAAGRCIAEGPDRKIYIGGTFTAAGGTASINRIVKYDPIGNDWAGLGSGLGAECDAIAFGQNGELYAGGTFTTPASHIARWNGASWFAIGAGLGNNVYAIVPAADGMIYIGGNFLASSDPGAAYTNRLALWNGSTFVHVDITLPGAANVYAIGIRKNGHLLIGFDTTGTALASQRTQVTITASTKVYPRVFLRWDSGGSGAIIFKYLENLTTGEKLWLNYELQLGEELTFDFTPGAQQVSSSYYGRVDYAVLDGSDFARFGLLPGINELMLFIDYGTGPTMTKKILYDPVYWSVDGVAP